MPDGSRIPRRIEPFNAYIVNTNAYLQEGTPTANADRLGILPTEKAQWSAFLTAWTPLYIKYSDKKNTRTTAVKDELMNIIGNCVRFDKSNHILDRIAASPNVTIADMSIFNIKKGALQKATRTIPTTPISEPVYALIRPIGGGSFTIKCYSNSSKRASILEGADSVQYAYLVCDTPPSSAEITGLSKEISSRASFTLALGAGSSAKYLYIYFRWYNTRHPLLAGTWSALQTALIM